MPKPPYIKCRLVNGDKPLTARWYIVFYAWDAAQEKLVRKRDYEINTKKTKSERMAYFRMFAKEIDTALEDGAHVNPKEKRKQEVLKLVSRDFTVSEAFKFILPVVKSTLRHDTYTAYSSIAKLFTEFCALAGWDKWKVKTLQKVDVLTWLDYVQQERGVSNTTRNKYMSFVSALFALMVERQIIEANPATGIKLLREEDAGNTAYTPDQIATLKEALIAHDPRLWLFVTFLLYGFIRPAEIGRLKVKMVDLDKGEINLPGTITKNRKPRLVKIAPPFRAYVDQLNLHLYRPDDHVFGYNLVTGAIKIQKNYASTQHTFVARALGFGEDYVLYSWKHTGVVVHYKAGIDIKSLQRQLGHQSLHETDIYLRSLNLYENLEFELKSPTL